MVSELQRDYWGSLRAIERLKNEVAAKNQSIVEMEAHIRLLTERIKLLELEREGAVADPDQQNGSSMELVETPPESARNVETNLPEEVWAMIFSNFTDEHELWRFSAICQAAKSAILRPTKVEWLFKQLFPYILDYLRPSDFLKCREVSKSWKSTVDEYFRDHPSLLPFNERIYDPKKPFQVMKPDWRDMKIKIGGYSLRSADDDKILTTAGVLKRMSDNRNPFLVPKIRFQISSLLSSDEDVNAKFVIPLYPKVTTFLNNFGAQLVRLVFSVPQVHLCKYNNRFIRLLAEEVLCHTPNIKSLKISSGFWKEDRANLVDLQYCGSLPNLPKLETLDLDVNVLEETKEPVLAIEERLLQSYHSKLKSLSINNFRYCDWSNFADFKFDNLVQLDIARLDEFLIADVSARKKLLLMKAPKVKKLVMALAMTVVESKAFLEFLREIHSAFPELHILRIKPERYGRFDQEEFEDYVLTVPISKRAPPNFKTIEVGGLEMVNWSHIKFTFLLMFPYLENLHISVPPYFLSDDDDEDENEDENRNENDDQNDDQNDDENEDENDDDDDEDNYEADHIVEVKDCLRSMYKSNIWEMLPYLKILTVNTNVYTRQGYRHFKEIAEKAADRDSNSE